jgi:predicted transcriptional regulator
MLMRKRVWDIMRTDYARVGEDSGLVQVIKALDGALEANPTSNYVLVFSEANEFRGLVTMWNVLQAIGPCLLKNITLRGEVDWDDAYHGALRTCSQVGIRDIMQRDVPKVKPTDPLARIMEIFLDYRQGRAIVEEGGRVMGIVLLHDLYREMASDLGR